MALLKILPVVPPKRLPPVDGVDVDVDVFPKRDEPLVEDPNNEDPPEDGLLFPNNEDPDPDVEVLVLENKEDPPVLEEPNKLPPEEEVCSSTDHR